MSKAKDLSFTRSQQSERRVNKLIKYSKFSNSGYKHKFINKKRGNMDSNCKAKGRFRGYDIGFVFVLGEKVLVFYY